MKKALKIIAILLFAWAMASCTKENDPSNGGNGGNGNGNNGGNGNSQYDYTFGYYHPAKKIKEIQINNGRRLTFVWNGDDLSRIDIKTCSVNFEYNAEGRISCIWDSAGTNNYHKITYYYYADCVEKHNVYHDGDYYSSDDTYFSPIIGLDYDVDYDHANNPLKDLSLYDVIDVIGFEHFGSSVVYDIAYNHDAKSLHNRIRHFDAEYRYDYDNDNYPTVCWKLYHLINGFGEQIDEYHKFYSINYYPMGGNSGYGSYNGHDYVDLGLPSGALWATCDVGADVPEAYGDYFAWGETSPKNNYSSWNWNNYKWCNGDEYTLTKYCTSSGYGYNGFVDNLTILQSCDDAATVNWGSGWRTPTEEECRELFSYTTRKTVTQNEVKGILVTGPNGNSIFLPLSGPYSYHFGRTCYYWSNSLNGGTSSEAICFGFFANNMSGVAWEDRCYGYCVRPVCTMH